MLADLQVLHDVFAQAGLRLDETLDHPVEVEGGQLEHVQDPGEAKVRLRGLPVAAGCVGVPSGLHTGTCTAPGPVYYYRDVMLLDSVVLCLLDSGPTMRSYSRTSNTADDQRRTHLRKLP